MSTSCDGSVDLVVRLAGHIDGPSMTPPSRWSDQRPGDTIHIASPPSSHLLEDSQEFLLDSESNIPQRMGAPSHALFGAGFRTPIACLGFPPLTEDTQTILLNPKKTRQNWPLLLQKRTTTSIDKPIFEAVSLHHSHRSCA